jgi:hypothetical protein
MQNKQLSLGALATCLAIAAAADTGANTSGQTFDWIVGHWCADRGGRFIEESWLDMRGGLALGMSRTIKDGRTVSFEFMRIEIGAEASFIAQPQGSPPAVFKLTGSGAGWARFENPAHDFPNLVEYRRTADGLRAHISGPGRDGKPMVIPFEYTACPRHAP